MSRALLFVSFVLCLRNLCAAENARAVSIVVDQSLSRTAQHGMAKLQSALRAKGWIEQSAVSLDVATGEVVVIAGTVSGNGPAARALRESGGIAPSAAGALAGGKMSSQ